MIGTASGDGPPPRMRLEDFHATGPCPVVGCPVTTRLGICCEHGDVSHWMEAQIGDPDLPPPEARDFGPPELRLAWALERAKTQQPQLPPGALIAPAPEAVSRPTRPDQAAQPGPLTRRQLLSRIRRS